jgi:hypothetical protein
MAVLEILIKGNAKYKHCKDGKIGLEIVWIILDAIGPMDKPQRNGEQEEIADIFDGGIPEQPDQKKGGQ